METNNYGGLKMNNISINSVLLARAYLFGKFWHSINNVTQSLLDGRVLERSKVISM